MLETPSVEEFFQKLRATSRTWWLYRETLLRTAAETNLACQCPLTAVAGLAGAGDFYLAGAALGLDEAQTREIARAADASELGYDPELRRRLLEACGLS